MTDITTRLLSMSEAMYMDRDQDEIDALLLEAKAEIERLRAIANAAEAYIASVNGEPEKDCWDTEDGKEAPGAERFASDWAWQEYDAKKQKAFDDLLAALIPQQKGNADGK